jgi:hypothetical protein
MATKMMHRLLLVIGLGSLAIGPALADIVDVTVNGSASGFGDLAVATAAGIVTIPYSFSGTNAQLGEFDLSGRAVNPFNTGSSIEASTQQVTTATADALQITLDEGYSFFCCSAGYGVNLNNSIALSFNLTQESTMQFNDPLANLCCSFNGAMASFTGELLDSKGDVVLVVDPSGSCGGFCASTVLQPGTYQMDASLALSTSGGMFPGGAFFGIGEDATFTPIVPEPRGAILATLLAATFGGYVFSRCWQIA